MKLAATATRTFFGGNSAGKACEHESGGKLLHLHDFFSMGGVEPH